MGFDPADEGQDNKAYAMIHGSYVEDVHHWADGDVGDATDKIWEVANRNHMTDIIYDNIGIGSSVKIKFNQIIGNSQMNIRGFSSSGEVDDPEKKYMDDRINADVFQNIRAQYWWYLRDRFEDTYNAVERGIYSDPDKLISLNSNMPLLKQLKAELTRVQRKRSRRSNGLILIESKQDMKARALKSPNLADALVYAFAYKNTNKSWSKPIDYSRMDKAIQR
jgi:phage terminase large subunit